MRPSPWMYGWHTPSPAALRRNKASHLKGKVHRDIKPEHILMVVYAHARACLTLILTSTLTLMKLAGNSCSLVLLLLTVLTQGRRQFDAKIDAKTNDGFIYDLGSA